ncbi:helix-turn-helix domain-containing protein [Burkholderia pseudomultivorans]|uniref:helix-turn-helix domain-containing protein n=1 Tax=Burkholderia pseudomultivorans TaxID=1207504 RepID=UPI000AB083D0|nr:helix-turn-helix domain-containing protein [Burkholderia pseudomultivorans]
MTQKIHKARQRALLARTMLDTLREFCAAYLSRKRFGSRADELVLLAAVFVGQAEGRPMNASKLAAYAGIPRPTVIRKLQALARRGVLERIDGGLYALPARVVNSAAVLRAADASRKRIRRAAAAIADQ